jgi:hypothetical protein
MVKKSNNLATEHMIKQRKKKNLSDEYIYGSQGGSVELHKLFNYKIGDEKLGLIIAKLIEENKNVNIRLDNTKTALKTMLDRIETIERKLKKYGLE